MAGHENSSAVLDALNRIYALMAESAQSSGAPGESSATELAVSMKELSEKIDALVSALNRTGEYAVQVTVAGADGAIQDLVSRVIEEVLIRVKQENLLAITNG